MTMREKLAADLGLKLLALALAIALWLYVTGGKDTELAVEVPVKVINLAPGVALATQPPARLDVRVAGPALILRRLRPDKMVVSLDMRRVQAGSVAFPALDRLVPVPAGIRVVRISPAAIQLTVLTAEK